MTATAIIPDKARFLPPAASAARLFRGRPLIAWPITVALASGLFDRVIVATGDPAIATIARDAGAEVAPEPAQDTDVAAATIRRMGLGEDVILALIQPAAVLLQAGDLQAGLARLQDSGADFVLSAASYPAPVDRALVIDRTAPGGHVRMMRQENLFLRSQDLIEACHDAGQFRIGRAACWLAGPTDPSHTTVPVILPRHRVPDLRSEADWARAEILAGLLARGSSGAGS